MLTVVLWVCAPWHVLFAGSVSRGWVRKWCADLVIGEWIQKWCWLDRRVCANVPWNWFYSAGGLCCSACAGTPPSCHRHGPRGRSPSHKVPDSPSPPFADEGVPQETPPEASKIRVLTSSLKIELMVDRRKAAFSAHKINCI